MSSWSGVCLSRAHLFEAVRAREQILQIHLVTIYCFLNVFSPFSPSSRICAIELPQSRCQDLTTFGRRKGVQMEYEIVVVHTGISRTERPDVCARLRLPDWAG